MKIKYPAKAVHALSVDDVLTGFETDARSGISQPTAEERNQEFGANSYQAQKEKSLWILLLQQFKSPIVYLLVVGAAVSVYFQDYPEAIAIALVILLNALIGFFMELQARSSMKALREMDVILTKVIRDGKTIEIPSEKITPGDLVFLEAGDVVPGDGRLIEVNSLQCDESSLTGESLPTEKNTAVLPEDTLPGDRLNMVFKGTSVMNGNGKAIITGIAAHTELGTITSLVENAAETATPLDKKLNALSKNLIWVTLFMTAVFAVTGFVQGKKWVLILETSIALAVAAIPEGLPIVATVALAYGVVLMARRNAIVKKLSSVETLGSTNVILTDKTGTLTENKIYVETFAFPGEKVNVRIEEDVLKFVKGAIEKRKGNFEKLQLVSALCNNASVNKDSTEKKETGDPVEIALLHLSHSAGNSQEEYLKKYPRTAEIPFNSDTKIMGTLHQAPNGELVTVKGSVEHVVERCSSILTDTSVVTLNEQQREQIMMESEDMSAEGLRVLAFAYREEKEIGKDNFAENLIYIGMIGFLDPPRLDIREAVLSCRKAGIKVVMVTGDHPKTALNIAKKTGLVDEHEQNVIAGKDLPPLESLTEEWKARILSTFVFARATPRQKLDIADVYQQAGNIVAMTGDGVNDAPALKKADVGIAMGLRGTPVAKETASIVLKDDSFTSIAEAVAYGREIFQNIQKFVIYLVSCNLSEIFIVTLLGFIAPASTLFPLQILFLNMVTDVLPALALGVGKGDPSIMEKPPRNPDAGIVSKKDWMAISFYSVAMTLAVVAAVLYCRYALFEDEVLLNNVAFATLALAQLFHVFNMASPTSGVWVNEITRNKYIWFAFGICSGLLVLVFLLPGVREVLHLVPLPTETFIVIVLASLLPLLPIRLYRFLTNKKTS